MKEVAHQGQGCPFFIFIYLFFFCTENLKQPRCRIVLLPGCEIDLCLNKLLPSTTAPYLERCCANCLSIIHSYVPTVICNGLLSPRGPMKLNLDNINPKQEV